MPVDVREGPSWSNDGRRLLLASKNPAAIYSMPVEGGPPQLMGTGVGLNELHFLNASPDGTQIVYTAYPDPTTTSDIFVMNADGTHQRNVTNTPAADDTQPTWCADGKSIVFVRRGKLWMKRLRAAASAKDLNVRGGAPTLCALYRSQVAL